MYEEGWMERTWKFSVSVGWIITCHRGRPGRDPECKPTRIPHAKGYDSLCPITVIVPDISISYPV